MYCRYCGTEAANGERVCKKCGAYVPPPDAPTDQPRKQGGLFKWLICLLIILAIGFIVLALNNTHDLFVYSSISFSINGKIDAAEKSDYESTYENTVFYKLDDEYIVFNPKTGLYSTEASLQESYDGFADVTFSTSYKYAYVEISDPESNDKITISYFKASIIERIIFAAKYIEWI